MSALRARYGAGPGHLLAHVLALGLAAWALLELLELRRAWAVVGWLVAAVVLHDLVILPVYSLLDRALRGALPPAAVNHVRIPAGLSLLLLAIFVPVVLGYGDEVFRSAAGIEREGYLGRWVLITLGLFLASGGLYLARRALRRGGGSST